MQRPWTIDAQKLEIGEIQSSTVLFIANRAIDRFLDPDRKESTVLIAPKGFGKTFVLKLKRVKIQGDNINILPKDIIVDRPFNSPSQLPNNLIGQLERSDSWENIWCVVFSTLLIANSADAVTYSTFMQRLRDVIPAKSLVSDILESRPSSAFIILDSILTLNHKAIINLTKRISAITSMLGYVKGQHYVFVDNVDEYVDSLLNLPSKIPAARKNAVWHSAQVGLWRAIRRLQGINAHFKIFTTIRKEAYFYAKSTEPTIQNLESFAIQLKYSNSDLEQIIDNNIDYEPGLAEKSSTDRITRFVGREASSINNIATGSVETLIQYWLRHCIDRPRDAMQIGAAISDINPSRRTAKTVRDAIHGAAEEQLEKLFTEVAPHIPSLDPDLLTTAIRGNVLSKSVLQTGAENYAAAFEQKHGLPTSGQNGNHKHIFCALHSLGLLGRVVPEAGETGKMLQEFAGFGEIELGKFGTLPGSKTYLIHPALSDFLARRDENYDRRLNVKNVIGKGLPWIDDDGYFYILVGDCKEWSLRVGDYDKVRGWDNYWHTLSSDIKESFALKYCEVGEGDAVTIADHSPESVFCAAAEFAKQLHASRFELDIRFGGHAGYTDVTGDKIGSSNVIIYAKRLLSALNGAGLLASEEFFRGIKKSNQVKAANFREARSEDVRSALVAGRFNVAKEGHANMLVKLQICDQLTD